MEIGLLPQLADLGLETAIDADRAVLVLKGGETGGFARLKHYIWQPLPVEQQRFGITIRVDYPSPLVALLKSAAANENVYNAAVKPG